MCAAGKYYFGDITDQQRQDLGLEEVKIEPLSVVEKLFTKELTIGHAGLAFFKKGPRQSIKEAVSDGDTVRLGVWGNLSTRFLGIDTPEKSFKLLESRTDSGGSDYTSFISLDDDRWADFLAGPFTMDVSSYLGPGAQGPLPPYYLSIGLYEYLKPKLVREAAENHYLHASAATRYLERLVVEDLKHLVDSEGNRRFDSEGAFRFFLAFAHEVMDGYGRLLCILKPDEPDEPAGGRQQSYNLRMLEAGMALPYFIFPNIEPWRKQEFILNAVFEPADVPELLEKPTLKTARRYVRQARDPNDPKGVFAELKENGQKIAESLILSPHEIRFLAKRRPPPRYVIDLSQKAEHTGKLLHPQNYYQIENIEDRLYIPVEYVPLFVERGWQVQQLADG